MADRSIFKGNLVRLTAINPSTDAQSFSAWYRNSEFLRLFNSSPARPLSSNFMEQDLEVSSRIIPSAYRLAIRTLTDNELIGWLELDDVQWPHGVGWVGIGIGNPDYWSRGYGTDAMRVLMRFAFLEVNLHRLSLNVFEYNQRALHVYEKLGFKVEGRVKGYLHRDGRRWDVIYLGLLRPEWQDI
jgi:RimJ/RimL family protein N-acetyltransferase